MIRLDSVSKRFNNGLLAVDDLSLEVGAGVLEQGDARAQLAERGALRTGLTPERAADVLVTVCSRANYDSLVSERGWTPAAYRNWVADTLVRTLLEP